MFYLSRAPISFVTFSEVWITMMGLDSTWDRSIYNREMQLPRITTLILNHLRKQRLTLSRFTSLTVFWFRARMMSADAPRTNARFIFNQRNTEIFYLHGNVPNSMNETASEQHGLLTLLTMASAKDSWFPVEALLSSMSTGTSPIHGSCSLVSSSSLPLLTCVSSSWTLGQK